MKNFWAKSMYFFGRYWGCHQLPNRSCFINGYQFPLCARCMGILFGMLVAVTIIIIDKAVLDLFSYSQLAVLLLPMIIDGSIQLATSYESNNLKRVLSGFLFGVCIMGIVFKTIL